MATIHGKLVVHLKCQVCGKRSKVNVSVDDTIFGEAVRDVVARSLREKGWDIFTDDTEKHSTCSVR